MDRRIGVVRNSRVRAPALSLPHGVPANATATGRAEAVMVDVLVLSGDSALYEATRHAVGERNPVWRARSPDEAVDLMMTGRCGVLLVDMAAVSTRPGTLVEQIVDQFPDIVVVVAGRREDESVLAGLISDGLVYRFMHKPLSPKRAGMFLNAAMRSHVERRDGRAGERVLPLARELRARLEPRKWLFVGGGLLLFVALGAGLLAAHSVRPLDASAPANVASTLPAPAATPLADPVLSRARAALAAGRYETPPGRNALDLYCAVLLTRPGDLEARNGLATTTDRLVDNARQAAASGEFAEARRVATRVLAVDADHPGALAVIASLAPTPGPGATPVTVPTVVPTAVTPAIAQAPAVALAPELLRRPVSKLPVTTVRVQPDPLTPRIVRPAVRPISPSQQAPRNVSRPLDSPAGPTHAIAGYVTSTADAMTGTALEPARAAETASVVQQRDLQPVATPEPIYPPGALRDRVEGWVEMEFTVSERGTTGDVQVVRTEPVGVFDDAAVAAVAAWKFRPRVVNGQAVAQRTSVTLRFDVED